MRFNPLVTSVVAGAVLLMGCDDRQSSPTEPMATDRATVSSRAPIAVFGMSPVAAGADIIVGDLFGYGWCLSDVGGSYSCSLRYPGGSAGAATADFNNDGLDDFVLAGKFGIASQICTRNDATNTEPRFTCDAVSALGTGRYNTDAAVADFNNDDLPDFALAAGGIPGVVYTPNTVCINGGAGAASFTCSDLSASGIRMISTAAAVFDWDGDGNSDVVFTSTQGGDAVNGFPGVEVCLGDGSGGFATCTLLLDRRDTPGMSPTDLDIADFNGDGVADFVLGGSAAVTGFICLGDANGGFVIPCASLPLGSAYVAAGDFDGMNGPDVVLALQATPAAHICLNDGTGTFGSCTPFGPARGGGRDVQVGDLNSDGNLDVAIALFLSPDEACLGDGMGGFSCTSLGIPNYQALKLAIGNFGGVGNQVNQPPTIAADNDPVLVNEGDLAVNTGTVTDPDGDDVTLTASIGTVVDNGDGTWSWSFGTSDGPTESQTVTIDADDGNDGTASTTFELTVTNVAPTVGAVTVPADPIDVGSQPFTGVSAPYTDPGTGDTHTCTVDYADGSGPQTGTASAGTCTGPGHTYAEPGVYTVTVEVTDDGDSGSAVAEMMIVIYDPAGGFVTGGGQFDSPAGAFKADDMKTGRASFGFNSRYKKGASVPTGHTNFQFKAGDLHFSSSSYEFLVVNQGGTNAQFKGEGTINGEGVYTFMIWAQDNGEPGSDDTFRIRITEVGGGIVYDNGFDQVIARGNIQIHTKK